MSDTDEGMLDLPLGKALVPVEINSGINQCKECCFFTFKSLTLDDYTELECVDIFPCDSLNRKDGKNVIFKLADYQAKEEKC